ncbi:MAG: glycosyltransferase family A protein [Vicinamibacterales bacterium]
MPKVSVIIPAYNAEDFIREAVDSALAQTHKDLEVIVIDDSSTDDTPAILMGYGDRIRVHRQANTGVAGARNTGARLSTGEWLAFLDADDVWRPAKVEHQLAVSQSAVSYTDRFNFGARGDLPVVQSQVTPLLSGDVFAPLMLRGNFITVSSVMMRRDAFIELGGFFHQPGGCEDCDLWLRAAERHHFCVCREPLVGYRFTATSMSRNYRAMAPARQSVVSRALALARGQALGWAVRRRIWAETCRTNGWDAGQAGARADALRNYARAALAWPLAAQPFKEALKVWLHA